MREEGESSPPAFAMGDSRAGAPSVGVGLSRRRRGGWLGLSDRGSATSTGCRAAASLESLGALGRQAISLLRNVFHLAATVH